MDCLFFLDDRFYGPLISAVKRVIKEMEIDIDLAHGFSRGGE
jgi:hypothetical protein